MVLNKKKEKKRSKTTNKKLKTLMKGIKGFFIKIFNKSFKLDAIDILKARLLSVRLTK